MSRVPRDGAGMMTRPYSAAPRCPRCGGRAVLTEGQADRLAAATSDRLEPFVCLDGEGWHVWSPDFERAAPRT